MLAGTFEATSRHFDCLTAVSHVIGSSYPRTRLSCCPVPRARRSPALGCYMLSVPNSSPIAPRHGAITSSADMVSYLSPAPLSSGSHRCPLPSAILSASSSGSQTRAWCFPPLRCPESGDMHRHPSPDPSSDTALKGEGQVGREGRGGKTGRCGQKRRCQGGKRWGRNQGRWRGREK